MGSKKDEQAEELAATIKALREMKPISVPLDGSKSMHHILDSVKNSFLGGLRYVLDVSWNSSIEALIIAQNSERQGDFERHVANNLEEVKEWLQRRTKVEDLRNFVRVKAENLSLKNEIEELRSELGQLKRSNGDSESPYYCGPRMIMMNPFMGGRRW